MIDMLIWSPLYLSTHILRQLDKMIPKLKTEKLNNYFFRKANLLVNPGHLTDDDFAAEALNVKSVILKCFDESLMSTFGESINDERNVDDLSFFRQRRFRSFHFLSGKRNGPPLQMERSD